MEWKNRRIKIEEFGTQLSCHVIAVAAAAAAAAAVALLLVVIVVAIKRYTLYS
jgi:hypothetical protein